MLKLGGMWRALFLVPMLLLAGGCAAWRGEPERPIAPDPVIYPAPAQEGRYLPWTRG